MVERAPAAVDRADGSPAGVTGRRQRSVLSAAALTNGPAELLDFLLPLWAGLALGATGTQVGLLVAVELAVSVVVRPFAGVLADRGDRRRVAAVGAAVYGASCAGYAVATSLASLPLALGAAAVGGAGGALLWVALRTLAAEHLAEDSAALARLTSAEATGSWVAFVAGLTLFAQVGSAGVFAACAAACAVAAVVVVRAPGAEPAAGPGPAAGVMSAGGLDPGGLDPGGLSAVGRRLRPVLLTVVLTMAAESAVGILLLLHLQRGYDLQVGEVALVFLPGAVAMSVLPGPMHRLVLRFGRARVLGASSVASAVFAASLGWAPSPVVVAGLWVLSGAAWATVVPIQQAVVAEASGAGSTGRGMGLYESAALVGALVGSVSAGVLYDASSWRAACFTCAAVILAGAVLVPRAVRRLGVVDVPREGVDPGDLVPGDLVPVDPAASGPGPVPGLSVPSVAAPAAAPTAAVASPAPAGETAATAASPRRRVADLLWHAGLYAAVQVALAVASLSWLLDLVGTEDASAFLLAGGRQLEGASGVAYGAGRVWTIVLAVDAAWTALVATRARRRRRRSAPEPA